jgi:hypothetical protein
MSDTWTARELPKLDIWWSCSACHYDSRPADGRHLTEAERDACNDRGHTLITMPGTDTLDVALCDLCHTPENVDLVHHGKYYDLPDGTPTFMKGAAEIDVSKQYRYLLERRWLCRPKYKVPVLWVMLNPSTADALADDQTIYRVIDFSSRWGFGRFEVVNLFGYRTPHPTNLMYRDVAHKLPRSFAEAVGPENDRHTFEAMQRAGMIVVAWGSPSAKRIEAMMKDRIAAVRAIAAAAGKELLSIGTTKDGSPTHPMARGKHRVSPFVTPQAWPGGAR